MTEQPAPTVSPAPPETRGTLDVRVRALQHLVEAVARRTPGTVTRRSGLGRLGVTGSGYPRADVRMQGGRARVVIDVACTWPCRVADLATRVRDGVLADGTRFPGVEISDVDVVVHLVRAEADDATARRVG